jgi:hypothetical protein
MKRSAYFNNVGVGECVRVAESEEKGVGLFCVLTPPPLPYDRGSALHAHAHFCVRNTYTRARTLLPGTCQVTANEVIHGVQVGLFSFVVVHSVNHGLRPHA